MASSSSGSMTQAERAAALCRRCAEGAPHHTNSSTSIGGADRFIVWDIHEIEDASGVGLEECLAAEVWESAS